MLDVRFSNTNIYIKLMIFKRIKTGVAAFLAAWFVILLSLHIVMGLPYAKGMGGGYGLKACPEKEAHSGLPSLTVFMPR